MEHTNDTVLNLAGKFIEAEVENEVRLYDGWAKVKEYGFVGRS